MRMAMLTYLQQLDARARCKEGRREQDEGRREGTERGREQKEGGNRKREAVRERREGWNGRRKGSQNFEVQNPEPWGKEEVSAKYKKQKHKTKKSQI